MKNGMKTFLVLLVGLMSVYAVAGAPLGANVVNQVNSSRSNISEASTAFANAMAGNVTQLEINGTSITMSWQGFYGNVTGSLVLADSQGNNFYDWNLTSPSGEIYASRSNAITWSTIDCSDSGDILAEETYLGQSATDPDSVTNTFASQLHPAFDIGAVNVDDCYSTQAYNSGGEAGTGFWQVLLSDTTNTVYATIIDETPESGFNSQPWDFQLLVGENGNPGSEAATPYYFYVELQ